MILTLTESGGSDELRPCLAKVIVPVSNMQRSVEFYRDSIGLEVESPREKASYAGEKWVTFNAGPCTLALRAVQGPVRTSEDLPRLVIAVSEIEMARRRLIDRGVTVEIASSPAPGLWVVNVPDPDGTPLSLEAFTAVPATRFDGEVAFTAM